MKPPEQNLPLSSAQAKVMGWMPKATNGQLAISGRGMAPYLMAARALCRKGLLLEWKTATFALTDQGRGFVRASEPVPLARGEGQVSSPPVPSGAERPAFRSLLRTVRAQKKRQRCLHLNFTTRLDEDGFEVYDCADCESNGMDFHPNTHPRWPGNFLSSSATLNLEKK